MICKVQFPHMTKYTSEQILKLRKLLDRPLETDEPDDDGLVTLKYSYQDYEADVPSLLEAGFYKFSIEEKVSGPLLGVIERVAATLERLEATLANRPILEVPKQDAYFNAKCDVHVPGLGLLALNQVKLLENTCTDELQALLDEGWRVVAACPQPDQRRPDYVLGRYDPAHTPSI